MYFTDQSLMQTLNSSFTVAVGHFVSSVFFKAPCPDGHHSCHLESFDRILCLSLEPHGQGQGSVALALRVCPREHVCDIIEGG